MNSQNYVSLLPVKIGNFEGRLECLLLPLSPTISSHAIHKLSTLIGEFSSLSALMAGNIDLFAILLNFFRKRCTVYPLELDVTKKW
jgi:hypothetical protein